MIRVLFAGVVLVTLMFVTSSHADIYKYVDDNGIILFTNVPRNSSYEKVMTEKPSTGAGVSSRYSGIISRNSFKYNIAPSLIEAVISVESNWQPTAVSRKGAIGLMQLMPATSRDMGVYDPYDPEDNIEGGTKYLRLLLDRFDEDLELALAAYNAGPQRVERHGGVPPIPETKKYVRRVLSLHDGDYAFRRSPVIYKVMNDNGTILYTNTPTSQQKINSSRF
jgi:soluble lytic murein transglycosylase